jgi:site-specific recombinase XerD
MIECTVHQAAETFIGYLRESGKKERTLYTYRRDLALVARVAGELAPGIVCREVKAGLLDQVFSAGAVTESEADVHRMKAAVRAFFAWAADALLHQLQQAGLFQTNILTSSGSVHNLSTVSTVT